MFILYGFVNSLKHIKNESSARYDEDYHEFAYQSPTDIHREAYSIAVYLRGHFREPFCFYCMWMIWQKTLRTLHILRSVPPYNGRQINETNELNIQFLGVLIDYQLKLVKHVRHLKEKISSVCHRVRVISHSKYKREYFPFKVLTLRYQVDICNALKV